MDDVTENLAKFSGAFKKKALFNKKKQQYKKVGESIGTLLERLKMRFFFTFIEMTTWLKNLEFIQQQMYKQTVCVIRKRHGTRSSTQIRINDR